jgi:glycosyltransferase 2 family protein
MKKLLIGISLSVLFIFLIFDKFDKQEFIKIWQNANYQYLFLVVFFQVAGSVVASIRWYYLLEEKLKLKHSISSTFIGAGANMVLPARGGDLFRLFYCKSEVGIQYFNLLSKLFIEKVIDFVYVIILGVVAFSLLSFKKSDSGSFTIFTFSGSVVVGIVISLYLLKYQNSFLDSVLHKVFSLVKKEKIYENHIKTHLTDMQNFLTFKILSKPLLATVIMWVFYSATYFFIGKVLNIELSWTETTLCIFFGAISLAVPSAPSGIGVFHASIISSFIVMGKLDSHGLIFATSIHLFTFAIFVSMGMLFYLYWIYRRRNGKQINLSDLEKEVNH